ncbi:twin-arginine translocase TatA/TatE family subunit [Blattabacterium cuenoti]|uniref:twin-arginine translocase TatA/TatE family subunit n=1 Tax=Blattabacterium cuenoti TaxID=1653831 RepID=UPI00163B6202|nr:twin-arginine translocase TatA/TatE family subunit [Blattabacterium cuenoti]
MITFLFISIEESFLIIIIAIILFGPKKIPEIARMMGEGVRFLKNAKNKIYNEIIQNSFDKKHITEKKHIFFKKKEKLNSIKRN